MIGKRIHKIVRKCIKLIKEICIFYQFNLSISRILHKKYNKNNNDIFLLPFKKSIKK